MKKNFNLVSCFSALFLVSCVLFLATGCSQSTPTTTTTSTVSTSSTVTTTSSTTTTTVGTRAWTIMVYLGGDNDLAAAEYNNVVEMVAGGSDSNVSVLAQLNYRGRGTNRYLILPGTYEATFLGNSLDSASPETVTTFINYCVDNYPADHYMLILNDHGGGWKYTDTVSTQGIINDWTYNTEISMTQVKAILAAMFTKIGRKVDIFGYDACLMAMQEDAYQVKNYANYMVASEAIEPGAGWPYDAILSYWRSNFSAVPSLLAAYIVDSYKASMEARGESTTMAAIDLSSLEAINVALQNFSSAFPTAEYAALRTLREAKADGTHYTIQSYDHENSFQYYRDLYDLADKVAANFYSYPDLVSACSSVKSAVNSAVINSKLSGTTYANSHGLSIYFPTRFQDMPSYSNLDFATGTGASWQTFINALVSTESNPTIEVNFSLMVTWEGDSVINLICREFQELSYTTYNDYSSFDYSTTPNGFFTQVTGENNVIFQSNSTAETKNYTFQTFNRCGGSITASAEVYFTTYQNGVTQDTYSISSQRGRALASGETWSMANFTTYGTVCGWTLSPNITR
ncbi:MAG: clostripain-related cysteine peptidase [Candidatus Margulisiibacteriota bacterium]